MLKRSLLTPTASAIALALMAFFPLPATANGSYEPLELQFDAVGSDAADRTACLRLDNGRWNLKFEITGVDTGNSYITSITSRLFDAERVTPFAKFTSTATVTGGYVGIEFTTADTYRIEITPDTTLTPGDPVTSKYGSDIFTSNCGAPLTQVNNWGNWVTDWSYAFRDENDLIAVPNGANEQIGNQPTSMEGMFYRSDFNLDIGNWDTSSVTNMRKMFREASNFNKNLNSWDTSRVTNMEEMFYGASVFNQDIGNWDTSSATTMRGMFYDAAVFNQDINSWDVSRVTNMSNMFQQAKKFNQDLDRWDTSSVTTMQNMFNEASDFNKSLNSWDVSRVDNMTYMFRYASKFNQDLNSWDTSKVTTMAQMFQDAGAFNGDITSWNTSSVTNMFSMFDTSNVADAFNQDIGAWDVSSVTTMRNMFFRSESFNQDIGDWNTGSVTNMQAMFVEADAFNQDIGDWDVSSVTVMTSMFFNADVFNQDIGAWDTSSVENMKNMFNGAAAFDSYVGNWNTDSVQPTNMDGLFTDSAFSYCLPAEFFMAGVVDYTTVGLASDFGDSCVVYVAPQPESGSEENQSAPSVSRPYYGPISQPLAQTEATAGEEVTVNGFRMNTVQTVTAGDQQLKVVSSTSSALVLVVPENLSGMVNLSLHWINDENSGTYNIFQALNVTPSESQAATSTTKKINAGSFKGYVAIYALGYEGQRLSAKIGNDWVIVDPIVNNETASLARIVDFTGAGVDINLRVFIDRELVLTMPLVTK